MIHRNAFCWCGSGKKWKNCHYPQESAGPVSKVAAEYESRYGILLKTPEQIAGIRRACQVTAKILRELCQAAKVGMTTEELDILSRALHKREGAIAAPLGYGSPPYPKTICTSMNDVICHGIPGPEKFKEGDICNIDVSCIVDGYFGDCSAMVCIGKVEPEAKNLVDCTYKCLMESIAILKPGVLVSKIGDVIEATAKAYGCSVVHQFVGHGIGIDFHEEPQIQHCYNDNHIPLAAGMTFTIEPMINQGLPDGRIDKKDGWTARTVDGKLSAQWEHTLLITETGVEILTL